MANNDDFDEVDDLDVGGEKMAPGGKGDSKADLKKLWEGNPLLKIAAIIVAGGIAYAGYGMIMGGDKKDGQDESVVMPSEAVDNAVAPGTQKLDPAYEKALREKNQQQVELAQQAGTSAVPTPIGTTSGQIEIPDLSKKGDSDPLAEWRAAAAMSQFNAGQKIEEIEESQAEVIPMAQPLQPQVQAQLPPEVVQGLLEQMRMIVAAQEPKEGKNAPVTTVKNLYVLSLEEKQAKIDADAKAAAGKAPAAGGAAGGAAEGAADAKVIISAGNVSYGQLLNELNSDIEGPVLVSILSGPLAGGRAIGEFKLQDEYMTLKFERIVKDTVSYKVDAVALDEGTTLTGLQSDVDHHYIRRVVLPAAAEFVAGMGQAIAETASTTTTGSGGATTTDTPEPDTREQIFKGIEKSAEKVSAIIDEDSSPPITVKLKKGTTLGVLFLESVKDTDIEK